MLVCGIDEAGKGPVIGDLVIAGCLVEEKRMSILEEIGAKDSKLLSPKVREELYELIIKESKHALVHITAEEIDSRNGIGCNLNTLECIKMAQIINELKPDKAIIDCPHPVPKKFVDELKRYVEDKHVKIIAEHKADFNYPIVGAASIIAKVNRDRRLKEIENLVGIEIGSGYPHDPKTRKALQTLINKENSKLNKYVRHCWNTYKDEVRSFEQKNLGEF